MRPRPVMVTVPYGGGVAIPAFTVSDKQILEGTYKTKLYAGAFTQMLLQLACQQVNSLGYVGLSGVSSGWQYGPAAGSTGSQAGNLPSVSIFHAIQRGTTPVTNAGSTPGSGSSRGNSCCPKTARSAT